MQFEAILERLMVYRDLLKKRWLLIIIIAIVPTVLMVWQASSKPSLYVAKTVFHPETSQQNGGARDNTLSLILGNVGEGGETGFMIGVLESRNISEAVTSDSLLYKGKMRLAADVIIDSYPTSASLTGLIQNWLFPGQPSQDINRKIVSTASGIRGSMAVEATKDGFINLDISWYSREMAGLISRLYIEKLKEYYTRQKTAKASNNVDFFTKRADSVQAELERTSLNLARYYDRHQNLVFTEDQVYPTELQIKQEIQKQMFVTLTLSKEQALAQLQQDTPIIQVLDEPNPPYRSISSNKMLYGTIGLVAGLLIAVLWITRKLLREDVEGLIRTQLLNGNPEETESDISETEEGREDPSEPTSIHQ